MKTIFSLGAMYERNPWGLASAAEGRDIIDQEKRDSILAKLKPAYAQVKEIQAALDWSHDHDPYLKNLLGEDQGAFWMGWQASEELRPTMDGLLKRMSEDDPQFWTDLSSDESDILQEWPDGVAGIYSIYRQHFDAAPPNQRPGYVGPAAAAITTAPLPVTVPPKPTVTTTEVLTGVGILAALGIFVYSVT
jgi:hypothetical protein